MSLQTKFKENREDNKKRPLQNKGFTMLQHQKKVVLLIKKKIRGGKRGGGNIPSLKSDSKTKDSRARHKVKGTVTVFTANNKNNVL